MIDVDWRATRRRPAKRKVTNVVIKAIEVLAVEDMDSDREGRDDDESASEGGLDEDEFAHIPGNSETCADGEGENQQSWPHAAVTDLEVDRRRPNLARHNIIHKHRPFKRQRTQQALGTTVRREEQEGDNQEDSPASGTSSTPKQQAAQVDQTYPEATVEVETINARKTSRAVGRHLRRNAISIRRKTTTTGEDLRMMEGHPPPPDRYYGTEVNFDLVPLHMRAALGRTSAEGRDKDGTDRMVS